MVVDLVTDALACFRITRLVNEDVVLDRPRDAILDWATKGTCTAVLDDDTTGRPVMCERPGGHPGQHLRTIGNPSGPPSRVNWADDTEGATPPDPALRLHPKIAEFVTCPHCVGMWVAFGIIAARRFFPRQWAPISYALALTGFTSLMAEK